MKEKELNAMVDLTETNEKIRELAKTEYDRMCALNNKLMIPDDQYAEVAQKLDKLRLNRKSLRKGFSEINIS
jgi:hypothetical protein